MEALQRDIKGSGAMLLWFRLEGLIQTAPPVSARPRHQSGTWTFSRESAPNPGLPEAWLLGRIYRKFCSGGPPLTSITSANSFNKISYNIFLCNTFLSCTFLCCHGY